MDAKLSEAYEYMARYCQAIEGDTRELADTNPELAMTSGRLYRHFTKLNNLFVDIMSDSCDTPEYFLRLVANLRDQRCLDINDGMVETIAEMLQDQDPFYELVHLRLIESLLQASYSKSVTLEIVHNEIKQLDNYNSSLDVPFDLEDALLIWIRKSLQSRDITAEQDITFSEAASDRKTWDLISQLYKVPIDSSILSEPILKFALTNAFCRKHFACSLFAKMVLQKQDCDPIIEIKDRDGIAAVDEDLLDDYYCDNVSDCEVATDNNPEAEASVSEGPKEKQTNTCEADLEENTYEQATLLDEYVADEQELDGEVEHDKVAVVDTQSLEQNDETEGEEEEEKFPEEVYELYASEDDTAQEDLVSNEESPRRISFSWKTLEKFDEGNEQVEKDRKPSITSITDIKVQADNSNTGFMSLASDPIDPNDYQSKRDRIIAKLSKRKSSTKSIQSISETRLKQIHEDAIKGRSVVEDDSTIIESPSSGRKQPKGSNISLVRNALGQCLQSKLHAPILNAALQAMQTYHRANPSADFIIVLKSAQNHNYRGLYALVDVQHQVILRIHSSPTASIPAELRSEAIGCFMKYSTSNRSFHRVDTLQFSPAVHAVSK